MQDTGIIDTISRHVELKPAGKNYKGLCPFHHERTPSFNVNPAKQMFQCFGCGIQGNAEAFERLITAPTHL